MTDRNAFGEGVAAMAPRAGALHAAHAAAPARQHHIAAAPGASVDRGFPASPG